MHISVKSYTYLFLAILIMLVPLQWLCAWILAVLFHEFCHYAAVMICGGTVTQLSVSIGGVCMQCSPLTDAKRIIATLSGPIGGLLPVVFYRMYPHLAICAWVLSAYNLLPILPLDGGRILQILIGSGVLFYKTQRLLLLSMLLFCVFCVCRMRLGPLPLLIAGILLWKHRKSLAKKTPAEYNSSTEI